MSSATGAMRFMRARRVANICTDENGLLFFQCNYSLRGRNSATCLRHRTEPEEPWRGGQRPARIVLVHFVSAGGAGLCVLPSESWSGHGALEDRVPAHPYSARFARRAAKRA